MRLLFLTIGFLLSGFLASAKNNSYQGWITIDGTKIKFSISYTVASNNLISGTSITAQGTSDETKCKIKGKYNRKTGAIYFYETVVISSKAKYENLNFCLLTAKLSQRKTAKEIVYSGQVTGYLRGTKKKCASGAMIIKSDRPTEPKPVTKKPISKPSKPLPKAIQHDVLYSNIKSKKSIQYIYTGSQNSLEIWDDIKQDGDRVSIYLDGKLLLSDYELQSNKKQILLPLTGKHYLKIVAENEGTAAPNTSRIRLKLDNETKEITAHSKTGDYTYIILQR